MPSALDDEIKRGVNLRPHVTALDRQLRQACRDVEHGQRLGRVLDLGGRRRHGGGELVERFELDPERAIGGARDLGLELAEFGGGEAHLPRKRLAMNEGRVERRRHHSLAVLRGDLDEIAEHVVVADLERAHGGQIGVARLQRRNHAAGFIAQRPRLIEGSAVARAHEAAIALEVGKLIGQRRVKLTRKRRIEPAQRLRRLRELGGEVAALLQAGGKLGGSGDAVADGGKVAGAAARDNEPRQGTGEIGCRLEALAHLGARRHVGHEKFDRIVPPADRGGVGQRSGEALGEKARARSRHGAVDGGEQRSAALARERAHELEIAACRLVDRKRRPWRLAHRRRERRASAELRALDIADAGGGGRKLEPRKRAEAFRRGEAEISREPALGGCPIEHVAGKRRHRRQ